MAQKEYELIRAPFTGTIAIRYVDPGALIQSAVNAQTTALPVVSLSQVDRLRVFVYMDQRNAAFVRPGDRVEITDPVRPSVKVSATVTRMSGELDTKTRTLLTEVQVDNRSGIIVPGSFVQVTVWLRTGARVEVPADSLLFRDGKPNVAVVNKTNKVQIRPVSIVDSDGINLRLSEGIQPGEVVIMSPDAGMAARPAGGSSRRPEVGETSFGRPFSTPKCKKSGELSRPGTGLFTTMFHVIQYVRQLDPARLLRPASTWPPAGFLSTSLNSPGRTSALRRPGSPLAFAFFA